MLIGLGALAQRPAGRVAGRLVFLLALVSPHAMALAAQADSGQNFEALASQFAYDAKVALDMQDKVVARRDGLTIHDITYASPKSGRVTAYLLVPDGPGPFAPMLFGHWGGGNRTEFLAEAETYVKAGAVALLPDYPWVRPAAWRRPVHRFDKPEEDKEVYVQAVVDLRRGIDLLLARKDVDPAQLAYVGHSYGAQWGAILTAVDRRIKVAVLVAGVPDMDCLFRSDDPDVAALRKQLPAGQLDRYLAAQSALSAVNYVGHSSPTPLLFQFATFEPNFGRDAMDRYFAAAKDPKKVLWYDTGHEVLDPQATRDRQEFITHYIELPAKPARDVDLSTQGGVQRAHAGPIEGVRLVALNVAALDESVAWYRDNLGFVLRSRRDFPDHGVKIAMIELGGFYLEVVEKKRTIAPPDIQARLPDVSDWDDVQGIKKLAFSVNDLDALMARMKQQNVKFQTGVMGNNDDQVFGRSVIVLDNSGNWIQFCELPR